MITDTVKIGNQIWMSKNLSLKSFRNGEAIEQVHNLSEWSKKSYDHGKPLCLSPNNVSNGGDSGLLYNYQVVEDSRNIAPEGWRIPTKEDWNILITFLGGYYDSIDKMKSNYDWKSGLNGINSSGFNALPTGFLYCDMMINLHHSEIKGIGFSSSWWAFDKEDEERFSKTIIKLSDQVSNATFGEMLIEGSIDRNQAEFEAELNNETIFPYNACSLRLIKQE